MSTTDLPENRVRVRRLARNWSQAELAQRAGISRAAVSSIEGERLVPSVAAALALARELECTVEELFRPNSVASRENAVPRWAWAPSGDAPRYWCGNVQGQPYFYPVEATALGELPHDGVGFPKYTASRHTLARNTLVISGCDPAAGLVSRLYEQMTGYRMLVFSRSSRQALELLAQGVVHVAGVHLGAADDPNCNSLAVRKSLSQSARLLRVTEWQDGIAVGTGTTAKSVQGLLRQRLTWIGREPGSGARQCLDELLHDRQSPRRIARDHRGVADAIACGWADAGICLRLVAEEARLRFLPIRTEGYDLCYVRASEDDPRIQALIRVIQSRELQQLLGELPGYDTVRSGELSTVE